MSDTLGDTNVHWGDILVIVLYFAISLAIGIWTLCRPERNNVSGFFLAGRNMVWWPIGMSLFASNIGANNFVGTAGTAASSGYAVIMFEWNAVFLLVLLGWVFLPVYIASGIYTMPEYLQRRLGGKRLRLSLTIIALFTYLFVTLSADLYTGALFLQQTLGWPIYVGVAVFLGVAGVYTAMGGLTTVILTDALAVIIMVLGGMVLCIVGLVKVGGFEALEYRYMNAVPEYTYRVRNTTCGFPRDDSFHIFRSLDADYPWFGTMGRTILGSLWYWCANQVLVQRALAAKNMTHAKAGCVLASYLKLLPFFIIILPGMISRALYPDDIACADGETCDRVCENPLGCTNVAYPRLVIEVLPPGLRGLVIAVMLAAVISSLTSVFNSSSTLFAMDIWGRIRPKAGERETLLVSKVFIIVLAVASVAWIPVMTAAQGGEIYRYTSLVSGYLGGPTCCIFVLAIFWSRTSEPGAFWGMLISQLVGIIRFLLEIVYPAPSCGEVDDRPSFLSELNGYDYTIIQISIGFVAVFVISLLTAPPPKHKIVGLTYWTRYDTPLEEDGAAETSGNMADNTHKDLDDVSTDKTTQTHYTVRSHSDSLKYRNKQMTEDSISTGDTKTGADIDPKISQEMADMPVVETHAIRMTFLKETPFWKVFMNINGLLVCAVTIFLYGFFH